MVAGGRGRRVFLWPVSLTLTSASTSLILASPWLSPDLPFLRGICFSQLSLEPLFPVPQKADVFQASCQIYLGKVFAVVRSHPVEVESARKTILAPLCQSPWEDSRTLTDWWVRIKKNHLNKTVSIAGRTPGTHSTSHIPSCPLELQLIWVEAIPIYIPHTTLAWIPFTPMK